MRLQYAKCVHKIRTQTALVCDWLAKAEMKPAKKAWRRRALLAMELRADPGQEEHCVLSAG
jgi:hypothetical protein